MTCDERMVRVNSGYQALKDNDGNWIHDQLKEDFGLTTLELWECLGIRLQRSGRLRI